MAKVYDTATDIITFARSSSGTALRRVGYGDELVTNGDFATSDISAWGSFDGTLAVVSGELELAYTAATQYVWVELTTTPGTLYEFSIDCRSDNAVGHKLLAYSGGFPLGTQIATDPSFVNFSTSLTTQTLKVKATTSTTLFMVSTQLTSGTAYFDNVSVKEVIFDRPTDDLVLFDHPDDIPRIEYAADGSLKGLLIEEQRTNLVTYSDFSSGWGTFDVSLDPSAVVSPDGKTDALKLVEGSGSSIHRTNGQSITVSSGVKYTASVYAKAGERSNVLLRTYNGSVDEDTYFDLSSGAVVSGTGSVEDIGNGWFRLSRTVTATATTSSAYIVQLLLCSAGTTTSYQGDGTSGIYLWGFQLEAGSFATSYIPTSGSQSTRSPDIASIPVSAFGYNQSAGTVVVDFATLATFGNRVNDGVFSLRPDAGSDDVLRTYIQATDSLTVQMKSGGSNIFASEVLNNLPEDAQTKMAVAIESGSQASSVNGATATSLGTSTSLPVAGEITKMAIGEINGNAFLNGHIKSLSYFPRRLTNAQLQELTS